MKTPLRPFALCLGLLTLTLSAQEASRPASWRLHLLPRGAEETLNLTADQRKQLAALEGESRAKVEALLTAEQKEKLTTLRPPNDGPRTPGAPPAKPVAATPSPVAAAEARPLPPGVTRVPVIFAGGHETVPVDHGRPVVLIAAALGVKDEVFREAFSHVHPAGPGRGGPTDAEARANKEALMSRLATYGITDERLNTVSNFYRYAAWEGGLWKNQPASANALVKDGAIVGYEVVSGGYGYTTPPTVSVPGFAGATAVLELSHGKNFETNGSIASISPAAAH